MDGSKRLILLPHRAAFCPSLYSLVWCADPRATPAICTPPGAGNLTDEGAAHIAVEENNLLSPREFQFLFSDAVILRERFLGMTKSLIATWGGDNSAA